MRVRFLGLSLAVALVAPTACASRSAGPRDEATRCEPRLVVPDGFEVTGGIDDPHDDRVGVRIDLAASGGRELHYFSGMKGEFGEGLPPAGELELREGGSGLLAGSDTTWVIQWDTPEPCTPTVVLGTGMDRARFIELLREAGALATADATPTPDHHD